VETDTARSRTTGRRRPMLGFRVLALVPFVGILAVFAAYPILLLLRMSVSRIDLQGGIFSWTFTGTQNLSRAVGDSLFRTALWNSAVFILLTTVLSVLLGVALAIVTDRAVLMQRAALNVLFWPAVVAPVVVSVIWLLVLSPQIGVLNKVLATLGLPSQGLLGSGTGAMAAIVVVDVWHWTPVVFLLVYTALKGIDRSVQEAAQIDGATERQTLQHITLPLLLPAIAAAAAVRVVMGVKVFDEMYLLTHGGPGTSTTVVSLLIRSVVFDQVDLGYGGALSVLVVTLVVLAGAAVLLSRRGRRTRAS